MEISREISSEDFWYGAASNAMFRSDKVSVLLQFVVSQ